MKPIVRHILEGVVLLSVPMVWLMEGSISSSRRSLATCQGLSTVIADSSSLRFISPDDVKGWMADYGTYIGQRLDSVDLDKVETIIRGKSAVDEAEAWLTDDGYIHITLTQRRPAIRFAGSGGSGFYSDASGFVFPLHPGFSARVPVVDGDFPVKVEEGYKGEIEDPEQRLWLLRAIGLVEYMKGTVWEGNIGQITASRNGEITMVPREGSERFLFGQPVDLKRKFTRMGVYYTAVAPSRETPPETVDLRFSSQIICK